MFIALQVSIEVVRALRPVLERLKRHDKSLADQLQRSMTGVALNLAEGAQRRGKDQTHLYRVAAGSAAEARIAVELGAALGHLDGIDVVAAGALLDRQAAVLHRLLHPRR